MFLFEGLDYLYFVALPIIGVLLILIIGLIILKSKKKKKYFVEQAKSNNEIIACLGGLDNIITAKSTGSRLSVVLNNYEIVNESRLKELGVSSLLKMSNKLTLVIGEVSQEIAFLINKN